MTLISYLSILIDPDNYHETAVENVHGFLLNKLIPEFWIWLDQIGEFDEKIKSFFSSHLHWRHRPRIYWRSKIVSQFWKTLPSSKKLLEHLKPIESTLETPDEVEEIHQWSAIQKCFSTILKFTLWKLPQAHCFWNKALIDDGIWREWFLKPLALTFYLNSFGMFLAFKRLTLCVLEIDLSCFNRLQSSDYTFWAPPSFWYLQSQRKDETNDTIIMCSRDIFIAKDWIREWKRMYLSCLADEFQISSFTHSKIIWQANMFSSIFQVHLNRILLPSRSRVKNPFFENLSANFTFLEGI